MKLKIILSLSALLIIFQTFSQLSLDPSEVFAKCPNEFIVYTVTNTSTAACNYEWTVTNGEILGGFLNGTVSTFTGGNQIQIKWFNTTNGGSIQIVANCNPTSGNATKSVNIPILSINGVNPGAISGASSVTVNVTGNQTYSVPQINFPNIGSGDVNPKQVSGYEWEIPSGWTVVSGGNTKSITVKPDNCSGGNIRVRGKNTLCSSGTFYTNWSTVKAITRTLPNPGAITSSTGSTSVNCNDITPITYSISAVTGATSYTWTYPDGWQVQGQPVPSPNPITLSTNSITLIPNGLNGGTVTVRANGCSLQSSASSLTITVNVIDPNNPLSVTSSSNFVCTTGTSFTLQNVPSDATITWSATPSNVFVSPSGNGANATLQVVDIFQRGNGTITYTVQRSCGSVTKDATFWFGTPDQVGALSGPTSPNVGHTVRYLATSPAPGATSYVWTLPRNNKFCAWCWSINRYNTPSDAFINVGESSGYVQLISENVCGRGGARLLFVTPTGSGGCNPCQKSEPHPNPAKNELLIQFNKERADSIMTTNRSKSEAFESNEFSFDFEVEYFLHDSYGEQVLYFKSADKNPRLDLSNVKNGIYTLTVVYGNLGTDKHRIVVSK